MRALLLAAAACAVLAQSKDYGDSVEPSISYILDHAAYRRDFPTAPAEIALGKRLFFEPRLSDEGKMSCATCHVPARHFTDGLPTARGKGGKRLTRNTPSLLTARYYSELLWDGRAANIEAAALNAIQNPDEMSVPLPTLLSRLAGWPEYAREFSAAYPGVGVSSDTLGRALGAFIGTLQPPEDSAFDRFLADRSGLSPQARRGFVLFSGKADCMQCHPSRDLRYEARYRNNGLTPAAVPDLGRYRVEAKPEFWGAFRIPTLRNIELTAPYMHDGRFAKLEEVIEYYDRGGDANRYKDPELKPLGLTRQEKADLLSFLRAMTTSQPTVEAARARP